MSARTPSIFELAARCAWLDEIYRNGLPKCTGRWISGSGGHRVHSPCSNTATYADWADQYAYCDDHLESADRESGSPAVAPWAGVVRALAAIEEIGATDGIKHVTVTVAGPKDHLPYHQRVQVADHDKRARVTEDWVARDIHMSEPCKLCAAGYVRWYVQAPPTFVAHWAHPFGDFPTKYQKCGNQSPAPEMDAEGFARTVEFP